MNITEFKTKLDSKFLDRKNMKQMASKFKTISKTTVEACSVWKALDGDNGELRSSGFVLFRKVTAKDADKYPGRKLVTILKYKARLSDDADGIGKFFLGGEEIDVEQSKKYQDVLEVLIALP
jgi:hypothetical protein